MLYLSLKCYIFLSDLADEDVIETLRNSRKLSRKDALAIRKRMETEKDMQNCFGFDVSTVPPMFLSMAALSHRKPASATSHDSSHLRDTIKGTLFALLMKCLWSISLLFFLCFCVFNIIPKWN
jgi:hypothetical protein